MLHKLKELQFRGRDSSVSIVTSLRAGRSRVRILAGSRGFSIFRNVQNDPVAHPGPYSVGTGVLTLRYSVEVKNEWSRTCAPPNPTPSWLDRDMCTARHTYVPVSVKFVSGIAVPTFPGTRCLRVPNCTESHS